MVQYTQLLTSGTILTVKPMVYSIILLPQQNFVEFLCQTSAKISGLLKDCELLDREEKTSLLW